MKFNILFNLIMQQLTAQQKKTTDKYTKKRKYTDFGPLFRQERTYFPLKYTENFNILVPPQNIVNELDNAGFYISDYRTGTAMKKSKPGQKKDLRQIKIGKILNRLNKPQLAKQFNERLGTSQKNIKDLKLQLCITWNPYDIAGMSTDRNWTSCMNLNDGAFHETAYRQVQYGGMCAYLINQADKEIEHPYARIAIKRMIGKTNKDLFIFVSEHVIYGDTNLAQQFKMDETLVKILKQSNKLTKFGASIFKNADKYSYSDNQYNIEYDLDQIDKFHLTYQNIRDILKKPIELNQLQKLINKYSKLFQKNRYYWVLISQNQKLTLEFIDKYIDNMDFLSCFYGLTVNANINNTELIKIFEKYSDKLNTTILYNLFNKFSIHNIKIPKIFIQKYFQLSDNLSDYYGLIITFLQTNSLTWTDIQELLNKYQYIDSIQIDTFNAIFRNPNYYKNMSIEFIKNNIKNFKVGHLINLFSQKKFTQDEFNIILNQLTAIACANLFNIYMDNIIHNETKLTKQQAIQLLEKAQPQFVQKSKFNYILNILKN